MKLFKILNLFLLTQITIACHRSSKRSNDARTTTRNQTTNNKLVIYSDKFCNSSQNKFQETYCLHNSTCSYHLVPLNETHERQQIFCLCKPVSL